MTFKLGRDLVTGSVGRKMSQTEGISWVTAPRWVRAWHTENLKWASATRTQGKLPIQKPEGQERNLDFIQYSVGSLRRVCEVTVTTTFMF